MCMCVQYLLFFFSAENMASFEVDLILRQASVGEEVNLTVCFNPAG